MAAVIMDAKGLAEHHVDGDEQTAPAALESNLKIDFQLNELLRREVSKAFFFASGLVETNQEIFI